MVQSSSDIASGSEVTSTTVISAQTPEILLTKKMEDERKELFNNLDYYHLGRNDFGLNDLEWSKGGFGEILQ